jgi:SLT domain-containing protein
MSAISEYMRVPLMQRAIQLCNLTGLAPTAENLYALDIIVSHESGWNPFAINLTDSNAVAGHPSKGLMQTIDSTFAAYKLAGFDDIHHPVDNLCAGIRYACSRYKSLDQVPGVKAVLAGQPYQGY